MSCKIYIYVPGALYAVTQFVTIHSITHADFTQPPISPSQ
jgi:hypothetical protein